MKHPCHKLFSALLLTLLIKDAHAIVNMESLHTGQPPEGISGHVEFSLNGSSGNTDKQEYSLGSRLQYHRDAITDFLLLSGSYGESDGVKNCEKGFMHLRHMHQLTPIVTAEGFVQAEHDTFARLEFRGLIGGGARFTLLPRAERGEAYLGIGAFYSEERIDDSYSDGGTQSLWRANSYLVLKYRATDNTSLLSTTYFQPALEDSSDYRLSEQAAMKVKINERLSLLLSIDYRQDSEPPLGVEEDDLSYATSLSFDF